MDVFLASNTSQDDKILTKALLRAADLLEIRGRELGEIVGMSESTVSRLRNDQREPVEAQRKEGELALLFLRVFRSLDALVGGDEQQAVEWIRAENRHLRGVPLERMKEVKGLVDVAEYLDAMRGKV